MATPTARRAVPTPPSLLQVADLVEARLTALLDDEVARWSALTDDLTEPLDALRTLVMAGGKRLRPAFCFWGFVGAGGDPDDSIVVDAGAAFELLQAFALVHDDVMDGSAARLPPVALPAATPPAALLYEDGARWSPISDHLTEPLYAPRTLVMAGGKRLRPAFFFWGFVGAGGDPDDSIVVYAGAAFELLQAFALVHDDVMDGSATR